MVKGFDFGKCSGFTPGGDGYCSIWTAVALMLVWEAHAVPEPALPTPEPTAVTQKAHAPAKRGDMTAVAAGDWMRVSHV